MDERLFQVWILLNSENQEDLKKARELTRELLTEMTSKIASIFLDRLILMWQIASSKRKSEAILQLDREYDLIMKFSEIAKNSWEDERMMQMLIWLITAAWKEKQRQILDRKNIFVKEEITQEELRRNLLSLTSEVAENYSDYWDWFNATKLARSMELGLLKENLPENKWVAIDLWCANWDITRFLSSEWFFKVNWYDVSPDMIREAKKLNWWYNIWYIESDLVEWIPEKNNSIDLVVANFWSASEINDGIINEVNRILKKWWKAFLSFYNSESLMDKWWQPWQSSMETVINTENDFIEIPIIKRDWTHKVFKVYAKARGYDDILAELNWTELKVDWTYSHSFITSMMPPIFFDNEDRVNQAIDYEKAHCKHKPYLWHYLVFVLSK